MARLQQIDAASFWAQVDDYADRAVTREWVGFIADTHHATPVAAEVREGTSVLGYFCGLVFSRFGLRILGSPFPGWTTDYMGFALQPGIPRWIALAALERFAFKDLGCVHFEIVDRYLTVDDGHRAGLPSGMVHSYESDLRESEDTLFGRMKSACRRCIRKAEREGVVIEEAKDEAFAGEYWTQLGEVFGKQGLTPTYGLARVQKLISHLGSTGQLLLLRARDASGECIATGIYPALHTRAHFWGNASRSAKQHLRPNEALHWYAMRYWKARGALTFDWGGRGDYKQKYGCVPIIVPHFVKSRFPGLRYLREAAREAFRWRQRVRGWLRPG